MWDGNFNCQVQGPPRPHRPAMTIIRNDEDDVALDIPMIVSFKGPVLSCPLWCQSGNGNTENDLAVPKFARSNEPDSLTMVGLSRIDRRHTE